ncbi:MAG: hypothetical protein APR54_07800 [Candidatus Cloacimonas sp. SDB]|nr:MAG: hypothetical protein APR54_07800 [Candidatus Cloacimonas sp. SDB]
MKIKDYFFNKDIYKPLLAGTLLALSRLPLRMGFLSFFFLIPLLLYFENDRSVKRSVVAGIAFSLAYTTVGLHWISLVTISGFIGLYLIFGLYFSVLFGFMNYFNRKIPQLKYYIIILFWIIFEYIQNFGEFRFPWFNLGYSLADYLNLIQLADIGGVYLLSGMSLLVNILLYNIWKKGLSVTFALIILFAVWIGYGQIRLHTIKITSTDNKISLLQVSISQELKWDESYLDSTVALYKNYTIKAAEYEPDLIIWPESALPVYLLRNYYYREFVLDLARNLEVDIFTGFPHYELADKEHSQKFKFYNSAAKFSKIGNVDIPYYKIYLVPVGERMPLLKIFPILWNIQLGQANFEYGKELRYYDMSGYKYSPLICFEIAFADLTRKMALNEVDFIVNITNDAWFHRSAGTYQHAVMCRFRAVETRKQIFRAANTGYSLVVSPTGEIMKQSELFEKIILTENLLLHKDKTFFTKYFHLFPLVLIILLAVLIGILIQRLWNRR